MAVTPPKPVLTESAMSTESWRCPRCGHTIVPAGESARIALERSGMCQGCRAALTFARRPLLLPSFVKSWQAIGFPASPSWLGDVRCPPEVFTPVAPPRDVPPSGPAPCRTPASTSGNHAASIRTQQEEGRGNDIDA
jgi:hypothetical protein